jgi:TRAP-type transport system small permease protein
MEKLKNFLNTLVDGFVILMIMSMVVVVFLQVFFRYAVMSSPPWTEEFSRFNFIWLTFMGAVAVFRRKAHLVIDTLVGVLPRRIAQSLNLPIQLLISGALLLLIYHGIILCRSGWFTRASTMNLPLTFIYLAIPLSAVLMLLYQLIWLTDFLKGRTETP